MTSSKANGIFNLALIEVAVIVDQFWKATVSFDFIESNRNENDNSQNRLDWDFQIKAKEPFFRR